VALYGQQVMDGVRVRVPLHPDGSLIPCLSLSPLSCLSPPQHVNLRKVGQPDESALGCRLVCKAHRLLYHSTLGLRLIKKKRRNGPCGAVGALDGRHEGVDEAEDRGVVDLEYFDVEEQHPVKHRGVVDLEPGVWFTGQTCARLNRLWMFSLQAHRRSGGC